MVENYIVSDRTLLDYMRLVLDVQSMIKKSYTKKWQDLPYNFYAKKYQIIKAKKTLYVNWLNPNNERHFIIYRFRDQKTFWDKVYFLFHSELFSDDAKRASNVLKQVIFPDFCKKLSIQGDFSKARNAREAKDYILCNLYLSFFNSISVEDFIDLFDLHKAVSLESLNFIKAYCEAATG